MSVRQYIGARYVTKIYENTLDPSSAEWQASVNYEPLTMVTYNNGSYLSKKQVPASVGDPASNPTYWVQTGFYNGQIASLQAQIDTINGKLAVIDDKKFWLISDSFLRYTENWGIPFDNWTGKTSYKTYEGGAGFNCPGNQTGSTILQIVQAATPPDDITDVVLFAGANDCEASYYNVTGPFIDTLEAIKAKLPDAKIWVSCNCTHWEQYQYGEYIGDVYNRMANACAQIPYCTFIPAPWIALQDKAFSSDRVHPNQSGYNRVALCFLNAIYGGNTLDLTHSSTISGIEFIMCNSTNIEVRVGQDVEIYNNTAMNMTALTFVNLSAQYAAPWLPKVNYQLSFNCYCRFYLTGGTVENGWINIDVSRDGYVRIKSFDAHSNVEQIRVNAAASCTVPMITPLH